jgi:hypothetical protein
MPEQKDKDKDNSSTNSIWLWIFIGLLVFNIGRIAYVYPGRLEVIKRDISNPRFLRNFAFITILFIVIISSNSRRNRTAVIQASAAFFIAYLARLDMVFEAFYLIFILAYLTHGRA